MRHSISTLQVNLRKLCNQACLHCHGEAGPLRIEMMTRQVAEAVMTLLDRTPSIEVVDLTGGAPELSPHFRWLVQGARELGRSVIDRCNLTVLFEPGMEDSGGDLRQGSSTGRSQDALGSDHRSGPGSQTRRGIFARHLPVAGQRSLGPAGGGDHWSTRG